MSRGDDVTVNVVTGDGHGNVVQAGSVAGGIHFHGVRARPATVASRLAERPPWLVRLPGGAGVLVDARHVLTCADVPDGEIRAEFPFADCPAVTAAVMDRVPEAAVLRLAEAVAYTPAPFGGSRVAA